MSLTPAPEPAARIGRPAPYRPPGQPHAKIAPAAIDAASEAITTAPVLQDAALRDWARTIVTVALEAAWPHQHAADRARLVAETAGEVSAVAQETILDAVATSTERIRVLEHLGAEMLATFGKTSDGWRARTGQVTITRWQATLNGDSEVPGG